VEIQLKGELDESRRAEKELLEKLGRAERREAALQDQVRGLETRATQLVELLRSSHEMAVHRELLRADADDDVMDDVTDDVTDPAASAAAAAAATAKSYPAEVDGMSRVELVGRCAVLERKCCGQRARLSQLTGELTALRQSEMGRFLSSSQGPL